MNQFSLRHKQARLRREVGTTSTRVSRRRYEALEEALEVALTALERIAESVTQDIHVELAQAALRGVHFPPASAAYRATRDADPTGRS